MIYFSVVWIVFCDILAIYILINTIYICCFSGAPAISSSRKTFKELSDVIKKYAKRRDFVFVDLGCGTGSFLFKLARKFPNAKFVGVEINPVIITYCRIKRFLFLQKNVKFIFGSIFKIDIKQLNADFIYLYLGDDISIGISEKLKKEVDGETFIISNKFKLKNLNLIDVVEFYNLINGPLRIYKNRRNKNE